VTPEDITSRPEFSLLYRKLTRMRDAMREEAVQLKAAQRDEGWWTPTPAKVLASKFKRLRDAVDASKDAVDKPNGS